MIQAYNKTDLYNNYVQEQASEAWHTDCISNESYKNILAAHPCKLYTPNYFIRIALALLTIVAISFAALLFALFFASGSASAIEVLVFIYALICYFVLEHFVRTRYYFNAGVDNILSLSVLVLIQSVILIETENYTLLSFISLLVTLWLCIRFIDGFMAIVAYLALLVFVFLFYSRLGSITKATAPFIIMLVSAATYFVLNKLNKQEAFIFYCYCINCVKVLTLLSFYAAGNYFVIKELSSAMFHLNPNDAVPFGWLFWVFTFIVPAAYILLGVSKKDIMLMRVGLVLIAASCFTLRYYYHILPAEWALLVFGLLITLAAYFFIKYLSKSKRGFTSAAVKYKHDNTPNIEALIVAQAFGKKADINSGVQYGGGSSGGGGATGQF